jgi:rhodanese-related sulfurtransferase
MLFNWFRSKPKGFQNLGSDDFLSSIKKNSRARLIDVRSEAEFRTGHIKGAKNINVMSSQFLSQISKIAKEDPIFLYCRSGNRSSSAAKQLAKIGYTEIYNLKGGLLFWRHGLV